MDLGAASESDWTFGCADGELRYYVFAPGWEDYPAYVDENGDYTIAIDPSTPGPNGDRVSVKGRFLEYARNHGDANDFFRRASWVSSAIVLNHIVAAIDAAVFARLHNQRLEGRVSASMAFRPLPTGEVEPTATLRIGL